MNTKTVKTQEQKKAETIESNKATFSELYSQVQATVRMWLQAYEVECSQKEVVPEITLNEVSEEEVNEVVSYLMHSQGIKTEGAIERNFIERWVLYYPSFAVGTVAGAIDSILCHAPGYRKNIKAGFTAGAGFGHYIERRVFEGAREKCSNTKEKFTESYANRKKEKEVVKNGADMANTAMNIASDNIVPAPN